jgi:hypothetical protein
MADADEDEEDEEDEDDEEDDEEEEEEDDGERMTAVASARVRCVERCATVYPRARAASVVVASAVDDDDDDNDDDDDDDGDEADADADAFEADFTAEEDDEDAEDDENLRGVLTERRAIGSRASAASAEPMADADADNDIDSGDDGDGDGNGGCGGCCCRARWRRMSRRSMRRRPPIKRTSSSKRVLWNAHKIEQSDWEVEQKMTWEIRSSKLENEINRSESWSGMQNASTKVGGGILMFEEKRGIYVWGWRCLMV